MSKLQIIPKNRKGIKCPQRRSRGTFVKGQVSKENHPHWKGGKPKCIDCGEELSYYKGKEISCPV